MYGVAGDDGGVCVGCVDGIAVVGGVGCDG